MRPYSTKAAAVKWYHIIWATYRRRRVFKIPALRRFCEQSIQLHCVHADWNVERACVSPNRVQLLVRASSRLSRKDLLRSLKGSVARTIRDGGVVRSTRGMWDAGGWCAAVRSAVGVEVVRHHLERSSATGVLGRGRDPFAPPASQYASSSRAASTMSGVWGNT